MSSRKIVYILVGLGLAILGIFPRLQVIGWIYIIFGLISLLIFIPLHLYLMYLELKINEELFQRLHRKFLLCFILFPMIFLFQPDFDDSASTGTYVVIEYYIGNKNRLIDEFSGLIALIAMIIYLFTLIRLIKKIKRNTTANIVQPQA